MTAEIDVDDAVAMIEAKLVARLSMLLLINAGALIVIMAGAISAYYSLESRLASHKSVDDQQDFKIGLLQIEQSAYRAEITGKLQSISDRIDDVNSFLRDTHSNVRRPIESRDNH